MKSKKIFNKKLGKEFTIFLEDASGIVTLAGLRDIFETQKVRINNKQLLEAVYNIFIQKELSYDDAWGIVSGASKMKVLCRKDQNRVSIELAEFLEKIYSQNNVELFKRMNEIDKKFKEYLNKDLRELKTEGLLEKNEYIEEKRKAFSSIDELIKSAWKKIKNVTEDFDERLGNFSIEALEDLYAYACIYDAIIKHTPTREWTDAEGKAYLRVADDIFMNGYLRLQKPEELKSVAESIHALLEAMTTFDKHYGQGERFSSSEIANILVKTPSLMNWVSAEKFKSIQGCLVSYVDELITRAQGTRFESAIKTLTAKDIVKRSASILANSDNSVVQATNFLLGRTVKEIYKLQPSTRKSVSSDKLLNAFPDMQIDDMSLEDNLRLATKQASIIVHLNFKSLYTVVENLMDVIIATQYPKLDLKSLDITKKKELVEKLGVDYNHLITGKNISTLFRADVKKLLDGQKATDMKNNIRLLAEYVNFDTIVNVMKNNINVLLQKDGVLQAKIDELLRQFPDKNSDDFKFAFTSLLNDEYYAGLSFDDQKGSTRRIKKGSEDSVGIVKGDVKVDFVGDGGIKILTDHDKYKLINKELSGLNELCDKMSVGGLSFESADDIKTSWELIKDEMRTLKTGALAKQLRKSIVNYNGNTTPKGSILAKLKDISKLMATIEDDEIKACLRLEIQVVLKNLDSMQRNELTPILEATQKETDSFYKEDKKHTMTPAVAKYTEAKELLFRQIDELSKLPKSIIGELTAIKTLESDVKKIIDEQDRLIAEYTTYRTKRVENDQLAGVVAELTELIAMLGIVKDTLKAEIGEGKKQIQKQPEKPITPIEEKDPVEEEKTQLTARLEGLKELVGKKAFEAVKVNYKGKDFKRLYHNMGIEVGDKKYEILKEIADTLIRLEKLEKDKGAIVK